MKTKKISKLFFLIGFSFSPLVFAALSPAARHEASKVKTGNYVETGFFSGGKNTITSAKLSDIRRAQSNEGYERIVLDIQPLSDDMKSVPYFQVNVNSEEYRVVLSIWSDIQYDFDAPKIRKAFERSKNIKKVNVLPRIEDGLTMIEFVLNESKGTKKTKLEAFYLENPARIILDIL